MDRRAFISGIAGGLLAAPFAAGAQQTGKMWRLGWLGITRSSDAELDTVESAFLGELRQHGFAEARNLTVWRYYAEGVEGRYQSFVSELLAKNVDSSS